MCVDALRRVAGGFFRPTKPDMSKPWEAESTALQRTPLPSVLLRDKSLSSTPTGLAMSGSIRGAPPATATEMFWSVIDLHPPENKWVNSSPCYLVVDEYQTNRVLLGCCDLPRRAYRPKWTLTRGCGFLAGSPLRATRR